MAVGVGGLKFHDLQSLAATALIASGADVKTAQTRMGHSSPQLTLALYARTTKDADRHAADSVGELFRPRHGRDMESSEPRRPKSALTWAFRVGARGLEPPTSAV